MCLDIFVWFFNYNKDIGSKSNISWPTCALQNLVNSNLAWLLLPMCIHSVQVRTGDFKIISRYFFFITVDVQLAM